MPRVLIVDDEECLRDSMDLFLTGQGFAIDTAPNGKDALSLLVNYKYDLVITDLRMPEMDGFDLLKQMKHISQSNPPVIVYSGYGTVEKATSAVKEGAFDFITKPFDAQHFMGVISSALKKGREQQEQKIEKHVKQLVNLKKFEKTAENLETMMLCLDELRYLVNYAFVSQNFYDMILKLARRVLKCSHAQLYLKPMKTFDFILISEYPRQNGENIFSTPLSQPGVKQTLESGKASILNYRIEPEQEIIPTFNDSNLSLLTSPLESHNQVYGLLLFAHLNNDKQFNEVDIQLISKFSEHAAFSINCKSQQGLREKFQQMLNRFDA
jgi:DNA-binding response OmpR family regulator